MKQNLVILGAGGNMGTRLSEIMRHEPDYELVCVESDPRRHEGILKRGLTVTDADVALPRADIVIMAIADHVLPMVAQGVVPKLKPGAMVVCLDPAAPHAGKLPRRPDISYFVTHPAHPPVFNDETDWEARRDFFGKGKAKQAIVNALMQGPESDYARGEAVARALFKPILRSHRVTVEQMAILEPVLSETVAATCLVVIREAMDEAIRRGVPPQAARDFLMGHLNIELAIVFNEIDWNFSLGAQQAIASAKKRLFRDDWKGVFDPEELKRSVDEITTPK
ncbi:MAG: phosphogluconate dehydrogenase C-terminal domain-containing protein [Tepidisphaerales bacterium]